MIISRAPVRISFFGGGTDYAEHFRHHGGAVLATAIDKFSYVTVSPFLSHLFDYSIRLSYRQVELVKSVDEIQHAVFRECLRHCGFSRDVELHYLADLPAFTGLGSSSAFTVSLLHALLAFKGKFLRPQELAAEAIHIEREVLRDNVGFQDQVLSAFGGFNLVEFHGENKFTVNRVSLSPQRLEEFERHLLIVFTGIKRKASEVVAQQLKRVGDNAETLAQMKAMAFQGHDILVGDRPWGEFGDLLHSAWQAKRSLDKVISNPEIDEMYDTGRRAGAWGGKLLGAGGGGFMLFFAPPEAHDSLARAFSDRQVLKVRLNAPGSQIIFS